MNKIHIKRTTLLLYFLVSALCAGAQKDVQKEIEKIVNAHMDMNNLVLLKKHTNRESLSQNDSLCLTEKIIRNGNKLLVENTEGETRLFSDMLVSINNFQKTILVNHASEEEFVKYILGDMIDLFMESTRSELSDSAGVKKITFHYAIHPFYRAELYYKNDYLITKCIVYFRKEEKEDKQNISPVEVNYVYDISGRLPFPEDKFNINDIFSFSNDQITLTELYREYMLITTLY
ncbi:hypothetical protein FLAV_01511 [Flavobacteriales bacterium]|nr:hypothetical protein [Flavobacteriales bacterium]CAG0976098.1 hypothetical protein FLAV_01511 [Flavobacteriales bacterium]